MCHKINFYILIKIFVYFITVFSYFIILISYFFMKIFWENLLFNIFNIWLYIKIRNFLSSFFCCGILNINNPVIVLKILSDAFHIWTFSINTMKKYQKILIFPRIIILFIIDFNFIFVIEKFCYDIFCYNNFGCLKCWTN